MSGTTTPAGRHELRTEIEQTRAELGDTVEALAAKTDVKARAKRMIDGVRHDPVQRRRAAGAGLATAAVVAGGIAAVVIRRRRG